MVAQTAVSAIANQHCNKTSPLFSMLFLSSSYLFNTKLSAESHRHRHRHTTPVSPLSLPNNNHNNTYPHSPPVGYRKNDVNYTWVPLAHPIARRAPRTLSQTSDCDQPPRQAIPGGVTTSSRSEATPTAHLPVNGRLRHLRIVGPIYHLVHRTHRKRAIFVRVLVTFRKS
ncbi:hypothetical protein GW17_00011181 [Ensete ventricosum]|nr:hypothetical protein GW17_00011181 [Ensete ventricosum]